jgi:hypothetical protein
VLLNILDALTERGIHFDLSVGGRPRSVRINAYVPGYVWEIEVFEDSLVEVEVFSGGNAIGELSLLETLLASQDDGPEGR